MFTPSTASLAVVPSASPLTFQRIVLPIDFSACAERALPRALALAENFGAEVHLLHVLSPGPQDEDAAPDAVPMDVEAFDFWREERVRTRLDGLRMSYRHGLGSRRDVPLQVAVVSAQDAAEGIARYAQQHDADLIVMGTHGWTACFDDGLGSVTKEVIATAACPVMTVPVHRQVAGVVRRMIVPLTSPHVAPRALERADALARMLGCPLEVLYAATEEASVQDSSDAYVASLQVPVDDVLDAAIRRCERQEADVVLTTRVLDAYTLARSATCSVLLLNQASGDGGL